MSNTYLEPEFKEDYENWRLNPTPENTTKLLQKLSPVTSQALKSFTGQDNPLLRSKARQITLQALPTYDPKQASLQTYLTNRLQSLRRTNRTQAQVVRIPERLLSDAYRVSQVKNTLRDELGREPSALELADHTGYSVRRLNQIERLRAPMPTGMLDSTITEENSAGWQPATTSLGAKQVDNAAVMLVYYDVDPTSRVIMDYAFGLGGKKRLSNQEIAKKLKITPSAVSQRKAALQAKIDEAMNSGLV